MKNSILLLLTTLLLSLTVAAGCAKQAPVPEQAAAAEVAPAPHEFDAVPELGTEARCPVMDHTFIVAESTESTVVDGKTYVFCCPGCKGNFEADPQSYLDKM